MRVVGVAMMAGALMTGVAQAQAIVRPVPGVIVASDIDGPYDDVGPRLPPPRYAPPPYPPQAYGPPPAYGPPSYGPSAYAPPLLPIHEIYRIVRDGGYSPLGAPQQRGAVYTITVLDIDGEDGRLVIDARSGRIIRFVPAYRFGARGVPDVGVAYGPPQALPPMAMPRPPASMSQERATVPIPKPRMAAASPLPEKSSAVGARQPAVPPAPTAALAAGPPAVAAPATPPPRPAVTLQPTQAMPPAQGVE